jgi:hypothetical protein
MDQFDTLKREATKLERSLEDKVSRYQQVRWINREMFGSVECVCYDGSHLFCYVE